MIGAVKPGRFRANETRRTYFASDREIIIIHSICNLLKAHKNTRWR